MPRRYIEALLWTAIVIYPCFFMFGGLDWTDQGYWVAAYSQIFHDPVSVSGTFACWLSVIIGGVWMFLFQQVGLLGAHLGYVASTAVTAWLTSRIVARALPGNTIARLLAVFAAATVAEADDAGAMNWVNYCDLSALFFVWAAWHVISGVSDGRRRQFVAAGAVIGANVFVRFPNVAGVMLAIPIVYHGILTHRRLRNIARDVVAFAGGVAAGVAGCIFVMGIMGHLAMVLAAIRSLFSSTGESETHGATQLVTNLIADNLTSLKIGVYTALIGLILLGVGIAVARLRNRVVSHALGIALAILIVRHDLPWISSHAHRIIGAGWIWSYAGLAYIVLALFLCLPIPHFRGNPTARTAVCLSLVVLLIVPLGSGRSLLNAHYGMWLPVAIAAAYLFDLTLQRPSWTFFATVAGIVTIYYSVAVLYMHPYRDTQDRRALRYGIRHPRLHGIFTHRMRAICVQQLVDVLPQFVHPRQYAIAFEYTPMIHYLTDTRPYLYNPNPMYLTAHQFNVAISRAEREHSELPIIFAAKGDVDIGWPDDVGRGLPRGLRKFDEMRATMRSFEQRHRYAKVWENSFFEIWTPVSQDIQ